MQPHGKEAASAPGYERHRPEETQLYRLVEQHYPAFVEHLAEQGKTGDQFPVRTALSVRLAARGARPGAGGDLPPAGDTPRAQGRVQAQGGATGAVTLVRRIAERVGRALERDH